MRRQAPLHVSNFLLAKAALLGVLRNLDALAKVLLPILVLEDFAAHVWALEL